MGKIKITNPPSGISHYRDFLPWLLKNFYRDFCAYCIIMQTSLEIDHYEPPKMTPKKEHHHSNLLPICRACNGRGGKSDYHPRHTNRTKGLQHNFDVINVRNDDLGNLFQIENDGRIVPRRGKHFAKAKANILLLKLDRPGLENFRREYLDMRQALLELSAEIGKNTKTSAEAKAKFKRLLPHVADRALFFHIFDFEFNRKITRAMRSRSQRPHCIPKVRRSA